MQIGSYRGTAGREPGGPASPRRRPADRGTYEVHRVQKVKPLGIRDNCPIHSSCRVISSSSIMKLVSRMSGFAWRMRPLLLAFLAGVARKCRPQGAPAIPID